jgi:protein O-mannosyl-transferase
MKTLAHQTKTLFVSTSFFILVIIIFWQTLGFDFIRYDDELYVTKNPYLLYGLTKQGLAWAFSTFHAGNWHPLTWISLMLDFELYGMNPGGYHLTNTIIHLLGGLFLFFAFREMTGSLLKSVVVATIFLIHPLHVEPVASVAGRKDVLSGLFWSLTILSYVRYAQKPAPGPYLLAACFFVLGLTSKPTVVTLPFVLLLLDYWPLKRILSVSERNINSETPTREKRLGALSRNPTFPVSSFSIILLEKIPFLTLSVLASLLTWEAQKGASAIVSLSNLPIGTRLTHTAVSYGAYLWKTVWPFDLSFFYPYPSAARMKQAIFAMLFLIMISVLSWVLRRATPWFVTGWFWFVITMLPTIGIIQVGFQGMADRYMYLPMIGLSITAAWGEASCTHVFQAGTLFWPGSGSCF